MSVSYRPSDLHAAGAADPLSLAAHGFLWMGAERVETPTGPALRGQIGVEYFIPTDLTETLPIVFFHGGGSQSLDFLVTPDGREGAAKWFLRRGRAVYLVDRPGHGRAPYDPELLGPSTPRLPEKAIVGLFSRPEDNPSSHPQAIRHSQWPGSGVPGDPAFDAFVQRLGPALADPAEADRHVRRGGAELLDSIGPAILIGTSAGAPACWHMADARPDLVKAIIVLEPLGPPFAEFPFRLDHGITAAPLTFDPPLGDGELLARSERPPVGPEARPLQLQQEPARRLPNLAEVPVLVVQGESSWLAPVGRGVADFLAQAGVPAEFMQLEEHGVHGNGHMLLGEKNSDDVIGLLARWIDQLHLIP